MDDGAAAAAGADAPGDAVFAPQALEEGAVGFVPLDAHFAYGVVAAA